MAQPRGPGIESEEMSGRAARVHWGRIGGSLSGVDVYPCGELCLSVPRMYSERLTGLVGLDVIPCRLL
jgi:hypothetical protein